MKKFLKKYYLLFVSIVMIAIAIILLFNANNIDVVPIILGVGLMLIGLFKFICNGLSFEKNIIFYSDIGQAIVFFVAGILVLFFGNNIINFIFYIIGSVLVYLGIVRIIKYFIYKKNLFNAKINYVVEGSLFILCGLICLMINASTINTFVVIVIAIMLIITASFNIYKMIKGKINLRVKPESTYSSKKVHDSIDAEIINEREE